MKKRVVKAWAIVHRNKPCEAICEPYDAWFQMTFAERKDAEKVLQLEGRTAGVIWSVVPCTITFSLPTKKRTKKV